MKTRSPLLTALSRYFMTLLFPVLASSVSGWHPHPDVVRKFNADRPSFCFEEAKVPAFSLPSVFGPDPQAPTVAAWKSRREEILRFYSDSVYGRLPGAPTGMHFTVEKEEAAAWGGKARFQALAIRCSFGDKKFVFTCRLLVPKDSDGPVPVFLLINNRRPSLTDPDADHRPGFWPAEEIISRGYGVAAIQTRELAPDSAEKYRDGVLPFLANDEAENTGRALAAWAWGASRVMDTFESHPLVDASRVAVVGHSRGAKAALWAGALDERFALVISNASGCGGAALHRRRFGETLARLNERYPHWFCRNFHQFADREDKLPVDQHMLIALTAPRAIYVASATEDLWADPRGEFLALAQASPVFELFGHSGISAQSMPQPDGVIHADRQGYHIRSGPHDLTAADWTRFMDFADRLWGRTGDRQAR